MGWLHFLPHPSLVFLPVATPLFILSLLATARRLPTFGHLWTFGARPSFSSCHQSHPLLAPPFYLSSSENGSQRSWSTLLHSVGSLNSGYHFWQTWCQNSQLSEMNLKVSILLAENTPDFWRIYL